MFDRNSIKSSQIKSTKRVMENSIDKLTEMLLSFGIELNPENGHLTYASDFKPIILNYELIFVRHGETFGNCGQVNASGSIDFHMVNERIKNHGNRIFQGNVDSEINQLTEHGVQQAKEVVSILKRDFLDNAWEPDIILSSPLSRAINTAMPLVQSYHYENRFIIHDELTELSFGSWDNRRVCDLPQHDICHLFYKNQHSLVKNSGINGDGIHQDSESFCDVIIRAANVLSEMNQKYKGKKIIIFSHSMFGAACCILLGKGQTVENGNYLAFDGKRSDGTYYTMPNASPFALNFRVEQKCYKHK